MPKNAAWTEVEIEAIVTDYIEMLDLELRGESFVKAQHNQMIQAMTGRSKGSVEFKYQNISAVMEALGLPYIRGYLPLRKYQLALFEAIVDRLRRPDGRLASIALTPSGTSDAPPAGIIYQTPPALVDLDFPQLRDPAIRGLVRKVDPALRDARARELGEAGEEFIYEAEKNRLSATGMDDLASKVRWVSREDGDGAGYDILSFSERGEQRWLEVKTTNGPARTRFWISENERRVSEEHPRYFRLVRLYYFSSIPEAYRLKPPLTDHVRLTPSQYLAEF